MGHCLKKSFLILLLLISCTQAELPKGKLKTFPRVELCRMNLLHTRPTPAFLLLGSLSPLQHVGVLIDRHWELVDPVIWTDPPRFFQSKPEMLSRLTDPLTKERGTWLLRSLRLGLPIHCEPVEANAQDSYSDMERLDLLFCMHRKLLQAHPKYSFLGYNCGGSAGDVLRASGLSPPFTVNLGVGDRIRFGEGAAAAQNLLPKALEECKQSLFQYRAWETSPDLIQMKPLLETASKDLRMPGISWDRIKLWEEQGTREV